MRIIPAYVVSIISSYADALGPVFTSDKSKIYLRLIFENYDSMYPLYCLKEIDAPMHNAKKAKQAGMPISHFLCI